MCKQNLKKIDIAKDLSKKTGLSLNLSKKIINDFVEIIIHNLRENEFNLKNVGTFKIIKKKERLGRNPKTREEFIISARNTIVFKPSKNIINFLNTYE